MNPARFDSPKRKRNFHVESADTSTIPPTPPSTSPSSLPRKEYLELPTKPERQTPGSPRTKVAYNFQGLRLEDAAEGGKFELDKSKNHAPIFTPNPDPDEAGDGEDVVRKRVKTIGHHTENDNEKELEVPETPDVRKKEKKFTLFLGGDEDMDRGSGRTNKIVLSNEVDPVIFKGSSVTRFKESGASGLARAYPSINRLADSKSRSKKRLSSPPLTGASEKEGEDKTVIVDMDRAALTWHDDEITGHAPTDPDDDGEGINGIGFKPTPAEAYVRAQKRRQQMAEYRNREAREARKLRSERRRGSEALKSSRGEAERARKVRFLETEVASIISIN